MFYSIAIDGPAGSGKSSVAKKVAQDLNFNYVNSGLFYRSIAYYCWKNKINYNDPNELSKSFLENNIHLEWDGNYILLNGNDHTDELDSSSISNIASIIATYNNVREFVNENIRDLSKLRSIVVDGRDIGTIVLPDATVKIFLDADPKTRAIRRAKQLISKGVNISANETLNEIIERDNRDYNREIAPLKKADDAYLVDSSLLSFDETVDRIKHLYMGNVIGESWSNEE